MIYWFIGQPGCGKTTLARRLKQHLDANGVPALHLDGDDLRKLYGAYSKEHFTKEYRIEWNRILQRFAAHFTDQGITVILSTVNPYRDNREEFKATRKDLKEIYVFTEDIRGREDKWVKDFEPPETNFIAIKTGGGMSVDSSFQILLSYLQRKRIFATMVANHSFGTHTPSIKGVFDSEEEYKAWCQENTPKMGGFPIVYIEEKYVI